MKEAAEAIVNARSIIFICIILNYNLLLYSVEIYGRLSTDLLPTPAKSHYIFNLRDLSKCIQGTGCNMCIQCYMPFCLGHLGVLQADPGVIREQEHIFRLFCHECQRVFHDRLVDKTDKKYFYGILSEMSAKYFSKVRRSSSRNCMYSKFCFYLRISVLINLKSLQLYLEILSKLELLLQTESMKNWTI